MVTYRLFRIFASNDFFWHFGLMTIIRIQIYFVQSFESLNGIFSIGHKRTIKVMFYRRSIWHLVYFISQFWISKVHFDFYWLFDISSSHIQIVMNIRFYFVTRCYEPQVSSPTCTFVTKIFELSRCMNMSRTWCHELTWSRTCICSMKPTHQDLRII